MGVANNFSNNFEFDFLIGLYDHLMVLDKYQQCFSLQLEKVSEISKGLTDPNDFKQNFSNSFWNLFKLKNELNVNQNSLAIGFWSGLDNNNMEQVVSEQGRTKLFKVFSLATPYLDTISEAMRDFLNSLYKGLRPFFISSTLFFFSQLNLEWTEKVFLVFGLFPVFLIWVRFFVNVYKDYTFFCLKQDVLNLKLKG